MTDVGAHDTVVEQPPCAPAVVGDALRVFDTAIKVGDYFL